MTDGVSIALIVAASSLLNQGIALLATRKIIQKPIEELAHNTNAIKDELVEATRLGAFAAGEKAESEKYHQK